MALPQSQASSTRQAKFNEALHEHPQVQAGHVDGRVTLTVGPLEPMEHEGPWRHKGPAAVACPPNGLYTGACCAKAGLEEMA